ncbi:MAG: stage III sporulation protein AF [Clostridiales bacterium]|jgi:stage III sporulation protein AF|nr:stage III sporulation protein AF [Clostridiales bacterium]
MLSWIISIAGVMVLTVLLDIILPDGQTNKYIKGIFSVVVITVVIAPVAGFLKGGADIGKLFDFASNAYGTDENFIYAVYADAYKAQAAGMADYLDGEGIKVKNVDIVFDPSNKKNILYVNIFLEQSVIDGDSPHINISDGIKDAVNKRYGIKKEDIRVLII